MHNLEYFTISATKDNEIHHTMKQLTSSNHNCSHLEIHKFPPHFHIRVKLETLIYGILGV